MNFAFFIYNRVNMYSGGQYHAFALGKALASRGHRVDFFWNCSPIFASEFSQISTCSFTLEAVESKSSERYDYIVIAPSGSFVPAYYEASLQLAAASNARVCLLNYESANWFNSLAPTPDDSRVWDYWRRVLSYGGLVISSTQESDQYARHFYNTPFSTLYFGVANPPINSFQTTKALNDNLSKDGSVIVFVRRVHDYKGGDDLLKLSPAVFSNRTLHVIFGGEPDSEFLEQLEVHYRGHNVTIIPHSRISVEDKYRLLAKAKVLLFPSYFEGFGYPPLEAFAVGTEVVCYDLPVLKENLENLAFFASRGDIKELEACLQQAFSVIRDTSILVDRAEQICGFAKVGSHFEKILKRHSSHIKPLSSYLPCLFWGPFDKEQSITIPSINQQVPYPPFVESCTTSDAGITIDVRLVTASPVLEVNIEGDCLKFIAIDEVLPDRYSEASHYRLTLLGTKLGSGILQFQLEDSSVYTEIVQLKRIK